MKKLFAGKKPIGLVLTILAGVCALGSEFIAYTQMKAEVAEQVEEALKERDEES